MTTRLIGAAIMVHGDDSGLILPPRIAPYQVVIVPIPRGDWRATVLPRAQDVAAALKRAGVRVMLDDREEYKPGWKFSEWEMRGVPLRLEIRNLAFDLPPATGACVRCGRPGLTDAYFAKSY